MIVNGYSIEPEANLRGAHLREADLRGAHLPSPTMVLLANWGAVSDELTVDLMRFDAACHSDPSSFEKWAKGGPCPYTDQSYGRAAIFNQRRDLYTPGPLLQPFDLMVRCIQEVCSSSDYHKTKGDKND